MGVSVPPRPPPVEAPEHLAEVLAGSRPDSDAVELREVQRALRARLLDRPSAPLQLQRYEIRRFLGAGGHGSVFEAFDPKLDRRVAIKVLRFSGEAAEGAEKDQEKRLLREARAIARTSDPRVVAVHDVGHCPSDFLDAAGEKKTSSRVFMVMEYVEGRTLRRWLEEEPRPADILRVFRDAARGLLAAHLSGVVHGDFKPENMMITLDHRVKILDFGIARVADPDFGRAVFTGTPYYASPEQQRGEVIDAKSDQYSFCRALDEAFHGRCPNDDGSTPSGIRSRSKAPSADAERVARIVEPIIRRGLSPAPRDRYASMDQLALQLEALGTKRRRTSHLVPVALIALAILAPLTAGESTPAPTTLVGCVGVTPSDVWNGARASKLEQAFVSTGLPYAKDSWTSVASELESYVARFRRSAAIACSFGGESTRPHAGDPRSADLTPSNAVLRCLEERARVLSSLLDLMQERPREVLPQSVDAVFSLRPADTCLSARRGLDALALPMPVCAARLESELYALDAGLTAATFAEGVARSAAARAAALECAPKRLGHWAELVHGLHVLQASQWAAASTSLRAAFLAAEAAGDSRVAMRAMTAQISAYEKLGEMTLVDRLIEDGMARANAGREDFGPDLEASFLEEVSRVRRHQARYAEAFELAQRGVELREKHWGEHHPLTSRAKKRLADVYYKRRDFRSAESIGLGVLGELLSYVGPHHPDVAALHTLLGNIAWRRGRYEDADQRYAESQRIWAQLFGPDDPRALRAVEARAAVHNSAGQFATAWSELEPLMTRPRDPRDESDARARLTVVAATALTGMARYEQASELLDYALGALIREKGAEHDSLGYPLLGLGRLELARGNWAKAREHCRHAAELWRERLGERHPKLSWAYACLGRAELEGGQRKSAVEALELARSIYDADVDDPRNLADIEFWLARSLEQDDPGRARALAAQSMERYLQLPTHREKAEPVLAWQEKLSQIDRRGGTD